MALIVDLIPSLGETNDLRNGRLHGMQTGCVRRSGGSAYHTRSTCVSIISPTTGYPLSLRSVIAWRKEEEDVARFLQENREDIVEARKLVTVQISVQPPKRRLETCLFSLLQLFLLHAPCVCVWC